MDFAELLRAVAALGVTLGLVGLAAWAMRRYGPSTLLRLQTPAAERRLGIVETLMLDPQRRLVLIRWDDEERLILLGEGSVVQGPAAPARARRIAAAGIGETAA
jgi:flagellar protein FliO/FliZ